MLLYKQFRHKIKFADMSAFIVGKQATTSYADNHAEENTLEQKSQLNLCNSKFVGQENTTLAFYAREPDESSGALVSLGSSLACHSRSSRWERK